MPDELIGKLVTWQGDSDFRPKQWFTARVTGQGAMLGSYTGVVVDPGNFRKYEGGARVVGEEVPNLRRELIEPVKQD